jgi:putative flippase GtrA
VARIELQSWWQLSQQFRFLLAGGYNTVFGYLVFSGLYLLFGQQIHYLIIAVLAHGIAVVNAYIVHRRLVFRSSEPWLGSFLRFNASQLAALGVGIAFLYALVTYARFRPLAAQAIVTTVSVLLTYLLHSRFSFRGQPREL